ncbi:MAG: DUF5777 family beta-barrel protein [Bacteroidota bacterium]|nr:DUF5777 family beta-barrel protein [Bacteroidota bacterium]
MKYRLHTLLLLLTVMVVQNVKAQDLFDVFGKDTVKTKNYTYATFKTTRLVNGQSIENVSKGTLLFIISHHFGPVNSGSYNFFGLDQSTIRIGLEYGLFDRLCFGIGRSSYEKTFDGFLKYKLIRQSTGYKAMPLSVSLFTSMDINSLKWQDPTRTNFFSSRLSYVYQILVARKFNNNLSLQLTPTMVHKNLVSGLTDKNDSYALGVGGRYKLTERVSVNAENFFLLNQPATAGNVNSLSIGVDIETGGHVFQLHFTNSQPMFERGFITETVGRWNKGFIYFGFNITRVFTVVKHKNPIK